VLESFLADVRFACRWLRKSPGFTAAAVASLAVGIGFNTALFAVVDALLLRPLPVSHPERLVDVYTSAPGSATNRFGSTSYPDYLDLAAHNDVFDDLIGYSPMFGALSLGDRSRLTLGEIVTGNYFRSLGVNAVFGRTLLPEDDALDAARVAMISYRYWIQELGGGRAVVGRTLVLRGTPYTIVGIAPRGFSGMTTILSPDLWVPMPGALDVEPIGLHDVLPSPSGTTRLERRGDRWMFLKGRLKASETADRARANLDLLMARLEAANPATNKNRRIAVKPTSAVHVHPAADPTVMPIAAGVMLVVGLVLLIACANVASMLLARATGRQKEIGIRLAIGASRGRLVRQLVTESVVLSIIGAVVGIVVAWWMTRIVSSLSLPLPFPIAFDLRIDGRVLLFTTAVTLAAGVLAGLAPALKTSSPNLTADLRGEAVLSRRSRWWRWTVRDVLVAGQMAVTAMLLIVAALLTRSLVAAQHAHVGFQIDHLALVSMDTGMVRYSNERSRQFYEQALARVRAIPGVESTALATRVPFSLNFNQWDLWITGLQRPDNRGEVIDVTRVTPEYFETMGIPILQGRGFTDSDRPDTPRVAIVNETMARRYWPGENAIGKTFHTRGPEGPVFQIVGVAADHRVTSVGEGPTPFVHVPRAQQPNSYEILIARTRGDAAALVRDMRRELLALEPNLVFVENQTMEAEVAATLFPVRAGAWVVSLVGLVAMALAAVGLYGVIAYSVSRRTREIGIRIALGARPASVLGLIMRQGLAVAAAGLVAGCLLAVVAARQIAGALYGVGASDPVSWVGAAVVLLSVSALANLIPARRAAGVEPSAALRVE
jgi:predicted permease